MAGICRICLCFILFAPITAPDAAVAGPESLREISEHSGEKTRLELIAEYLALARDHPETGIGDEAIYRAACLLDTVVMEVSGRDDRSIGEAVQAVGRLLGEPVASSLNLGHYGGVESSDAIYSLLAEKYPQSPHAPEASYKLLRRNIQSCNPFDEIDAIRSYLDRYPHTSHAVYLHLRMAQRMDDVWQALTYDEEYGDVPADRMNAEEARQKALQYFKQVIELGPETNEALQAKERLKSLMGKKSDSKFYGACGC